MIDWFQGFGILQWTGFIAGIIYVIFAAKGKWWCWPVGLIWVICSFVISIQGLLYSDAVLQILYFALTLYGWYNWMQTKQTNTADKLIISTSKNEWTYAFLFMILFTWIQAQALIEWTNTDVPYIDSFTTSLSLVATWLLAKKKIENWWVWIVVNPIYIWLFNFKGFDLYVWLYVFFTIMSVIGLMEWRKIRKKQYDHT